MNISISEFFNTELTNSQKNAIAEIESFLESTDNCFILKGYAGTGKTFLIEGLIRCFNKIGRQVVVMAPTGRAAMIIADKTGCKASTIHKAIYNNEEHVDDDHTFLVRYGINSNDYSNDAIFIVDEASMVSDIKTIDEFFVFGSGYLLKDLFTYIDFPYRPNSKILFIGDNAQLPPISMGFSPALSSEYLSSNYNLKCREYEMTEIKRQAQESGILRIATNLRQGLSTSTFDNFQIEPASDVIIETIDGFKSSYNNDTDAKDKIVIVYSNKAASEYNRMIRGWMFPGKNDIQPGDILINTKNNYNYAVELYNVQLLEVVAVEDICEPPVNVVFNKKNKMKATVSFVFRNISVLVKALDGTSHIIKCKIIDSFLKNDSGRLTSNEQQGLYVDFKNRVKHNPKSKEFKDKLRSDPYFNAIQVKYGYSITCHKAQGGEWPLAYVDFNNSQGVLTSGYYRWAYTGITRAKRKLISLNAKKVNLKSSIIINETTKLANIDCDWTVWPIELLDAETTDIFKQKFQKAFYLWFTDVFDELEIDMKVEQMNFRDRCTFSRNNDFAIIDFIYNGKGYTGIKQVISKSCDEFINLILLNLEKLPTSEVSYLPPTEFQNKFYEWIKSLTDELGIKIVSVANGQHYDRINIKTDSDCAYLQCYYNKSEKYTTIKPHSTEGIEDSKLNLLITLLKKNI